MRIAIALSFGILIALVFACNSGQEPRVMTRDGALQAELRHAEATRKRLEQNKAIMSNKTLGPQEVRGLKTEFAFWRQADLYFESNQLARAELTARPQDSGRFERFYFDRKEQLVLAEDGDTAEVTRYYFLLDRLVMAVKNNRDTLKLKAPAVKLKSINLVKEAARLQSLVTDTLPDE